MNLPIEMSNWSVVNNQEKPLRLFLYLKLYCQCGNIKWNSTDVMLASITLLNNNKTIRNNFKKLVEHGWVVYDNKYNYWIIKSFDKIRYEKGWIMKRAYQFKFSDLFHIYSTLGGLIYTQLYYSNRKKYKKRLGKVRRKRGADESYSLSCDNYYARISVLGVNKIFNISINKAVRLKSLAVKEGFISVKKQYSRIENQDYVHVYQKGIKYREENLNIIFMKGEYYEQLIDKINTEMYFVKRKKLETL